MPKKPNAMKKGMKRIGGQRKKELPKKLPERTLEELKKYKERLGIP